MSSKPSTLRLQGETLEKVTKYRETWTSTELEFVREFEGEATDAELAFALGRTLYAIQAIKRELREQPTKRVAAARSVRTGAKLPYDRGFTTIPESW